jgi:hypothetical protein
MSALTLQELRQWLSNSPRLRDATFASGFTGPCTIQNGKVSILLGHKVSGRRVSDAVRGLFNEDPNLQVYAHYAGYEVFLPESVVDAARMEVLLNDVVPGFNLFKRPETRQRAQEVGLFCKEVEADRVSVYTDTGAHYFTLRADATVADYDDARNAVSSAYADGYTAGRKAVRKDLWNLLGDKP